MEDYYSNFLLPDEQRASVFVSSDDTYYNDPQGLALSSLSTAVVMMAEEINATVMSNNTVDFEHDYSDTRIVEKVVAIVVPILFGIISVVGFFGNALVVVVVLFNPMMRSTTNILIINLAIADLLFIVFCVPYTGWDYAVQTWPFGDTWCRVVQYFIFVCAYASIYTLVLMSFDRFLAVVHPITSMSLRTERNAYLAISLLWVVILLVCIPAVFSHGEYFYRFGGEEYSQCQFLIEQYNHALFQICFFLSSYVIPLGLVFVLYMLMLNRLWFGVAPGGHVSAESVRSKKRVTRLVVVVVVIFAVCWCPIQLVLLLRSISMFGELTSEKIVVQIVSHILAYTNSCVNPILYAFLSENFRKSFWKVIRCNSRQQGAFSGPRASNDHERTERETIANCVNRNAKKSVNNSNDII